MNAAKRTRNKALMAADTVGLVDTNSVGFIISIDSISRTAFHTQWSVTVLANYGNIDAMFFITNNREERSRRVVFLIVTKGAHESTDAAPSTFLWINNQNLVGRTGHRDTRPEKRGMEALKGCSPI